MSKEINVDGYRLAHTMIRVRDLEASFKRVPLLKMQGLGNFFLDQNLLLQIQILY